MTTGVARARTALERQSAGVARQDDEGDRWRAQIERLRNERDEALERICQLQELLVARDAAQTCVFGLSHSESQVVGALLRWPIVTKEQLMQLLYGCRADPPDAHIINNLIMRVRRKLKPHGIVIHTMRARGYSMEKGARVRLNAASSRN